MDLDTVRHPEITVQLTGHDGNAFAILGRVIAALRKGGATTAEVNEFQKEAMSGDYDHLLQTAMVWVNVE